MALKPHHKLRVVGDFDPEIEFSQDELCEYAAAFDRFDVDGDHVLDLMELKRMMEKLDQPQTHIQLKNMMKALGVAADGGLDFSEFLLIFKMARDGELSAEGGLAALARRSCIDVSETGVSGAKNFFEAKANALTSRCRPPMKMYEKPGTPEQESD